MQKIIANDLTDNVNGKNENSNLFIKQYKPIFNKIRTYQHKNITKLLVVKYQNLPSSLVTM